MAGHALYAPVSYYDLKDTTNNVPYDLVFFLTFKMECTLLWPLYKECQNFQEMLKV